MNTNKWIIDWSVFQAGDILLTTSVSIISKLIRAGEMWHEEFIHDGNPIDGIEDSINAWIKSKIPSHSLFIYNSKDLIGAEMTWPKTQYCDLNEYSLNTEGTCILEAFRCPWLDDKHNPDAALYIRNRLKDWIDDYLLQNLPYGITNLPAFILPIPQDKKHPVCSMFTTLGLIKTVGAEGYDLKFPSDWYSVGKDNAPNVGLVSPRDQSNLFNSLGWGIPFKKYI